MADKKSSGSFSGGMDSAQPKAPSMTSTSTTTGVKGSVQPKAPPQQTTGSGAPPPNKNK